jgi:hypothetical protein
MQKDYPVIINEHFAWLKDAGFIKIGCHYRLFNFAVTSAMK